MRHVASLFILLGRVLISVVFLIAGISKLFHYNETIQYMASHGLTMLPLLYAGALFIELFVAFCLLIGFKTRWAAAILVLFLIPVSFIFHNFWNFDGEARIIQMYMFLKNIGIIGGLLILLGIGGGAAACDYFCRKPKRDDHAHEIR